MGSATVIPGSADRADYVRMPSAQAGGAEFKAKQLAKFNGLGAVTKVVDDDTGEIVGITSKDEQDGEVELYIGPILKLARESGSTIILMDEVYPLQSGSSPNEVATCQGPTDATGNATAIGYALRVTTAWVLIRPIWMTDRPPAASPS